MVFCIKIAHFPSLNQIKEKLTFVQTYLLEGWDRLGLASAKLWNESRSQAFTTEKGCGKIVFASDDMKCLIFFYSSKVYVLSSVTSLTQG